MSNSQKANLTLRIFSENREERTTATGEGLEDEELTGAAISWNWRFGSKTTLGLGADIADRDESDLDDELRRVRVDLEYQMTEKLSLRAEAARFEQKGQQSSERDYTENQYRLFLRTSF